MLSMVDNSKELSERLCGATLGALELFSVYLGTELGLYRTLDEQGPLTAPELSECAGIAPRYAREWLEQQAVSGFLDVEDRSEEPDARLYCLPAHRAHVFLDPEHVDHVAPFAQMITGIACVLPRVADAYRTGGGVPYADYGGDFRHGQGNSNRAAFTDELPTDWLGAMPDVVARLETRRPARVADVGCGQGWSSIAIAREFLGAEVDGVDTDAASVADARRHAAAEGLDARVRFVQGAAGWIVGRGPYDLILILEALHDFARPVEALAAARAALAPGGTVLVVEERVAGRFTAPGDEVERMMYGWSVTHGLPTQLVEASSAATGTVMRADTVRDFAARAGFVDVEVLPVHHEFFRLYRLR